MNQKLDINLRIRKLLFPLKVRTTHVWVRWLKRFLTRKLTLHRPSTYPFISGDAFRVLAKHIHDESATFDPLAVDDGDIVFLNTDFYKEFFETKHPYIKNKYVLISHNSDVCVSKELEKYIDEKILHWFSRNVTTSHSKITPIPIGLINSASNRIGKLSDLIRLIMSTKNIKKQPGISFGFSLVSGKDRVKVQTILKNHKLGKHILEYNQARYFAMMNTYSFVASPEGNGPDCHRTWEALYLQCIPIVPKSTFIEYFVSLGIPIYIIENWDALTSFDEHFLEKTYSEMSLSFKHPALYMDYWIERIQNECQNAFK